MKNSKDLIINYQVIAQRKVNLTAWRLLLSGMFAGLFIGLGGLGSQIAQTAIGSTSGRIAGACIFPVGLFMVVVVGVELFTGNCLLSIGWIEHIFRKSSGIRLIEMLKNWIFVFIGNFAGCLVLSVLVYFSGIGKLMDNALQQTFISVALAKISLSPVEAITRGILCNILVCIAVWMSMLSESICGKAIAVFAPVMIFVLCGFEHSVANMYFIPIGMMNDSSITIGMFLLNNLLPVTIGNIIGGAVVVGGGLFAVNK